MILVLAFAIALVIAVLFSGIAQKTIVSISVLFLIAGFLLGPGALGLVSNQPDNPILKKFVELALVSVLFTDGMQMGVQDLRSIWKLPGRALLIGLPLTLIVMAVIARLVTGISWGEAFLVGAVLSPTDPVFASAIVNHPEVPQPLRQLLNVESGINDGLALPIVLSVLAFVEFTPVDLLQWLGELLVGILIGVGVTWAILWISHQKPLQVTDPYQPLLGFGIGLFVYSLATLAHGNTFLASYAAGVTVATASPVCQKSFLRFGEHLVELFKLASLMIFGALLSVDFLGQVALREWLFAVLALLLARPIGLGLALIRSQLNWQERITAIWFGPRGFASVVYGLLVLQSGVALASLLFHLIAVVIILSIILHSSTDVSFAHWFKERKAEGSQQTEVG